jgi:hypothetical protein
MVVVGKLWRAALSRLHSKPPQARRGAARFQCNDVFAGGEDHLAEGHHALFADGIANDGKCLLPDVAIWCDVVRVAKVKIVNLLTRNELFNVDGAFAFYRDSLKFVRFKLDILILGDFVAFDDIRLLDVLAPVSASTFR